MSASFEDFKPKKVTDKGLTEADMRAADAPWPKTVDELAAFIKTLTDREHDYGTCVYAMSLAALAAFRFVSHELGSTGFQASCADMDFIRRTRHYEGPFMLIDGANALYPQYDLQRRLSEAVTEWQPWLVEEAKKLLEGPNVEHAHPDVVAHWKRLAGVV